MTVKRRGIVEFLKPSGYGASGRILPFRPRFRRAPLAGLRQPPKIYGRIGDLEVRQARTRGEIKRAQRLRYSVFYEELNAIPDALAAMSRRDEDAHDPICDHLLVVDHGAANRARRPWARQYVVGTYRVLRQDVAELNDGFYSQGEYDIAPLIERHPACRFMELGRSCVLASYRNKRTVELLWQGIWTYAREHGADAMIGCASFEGTDPRQHAMALSYLHHFARAPEQWRVKAHDDFGVDMNMMPARDIDRRAALKALPPLIKGYLRVGARIGDGAVVDHQFGTTDVFVVLPVEAIGARYFAHFGAPDEFADTPAKAVAARYN